MATESIELKKWTERHLGSNQIRTNRQEVVDWLDKRGYLAVIVGMAGDKCTGLLIQRKDDVPSYPALIVTGDQLIYDPYFGTVRTRRFRGAETNE